MDIYGDFLKDYYFNTLKTEILLHNSYDTAELLPLDDFFRTLDDMPDLEVFALSLCSGKVLDIGAGTGVHSLLLQQQGFEVTAIELSAGACHVMALKGIKNIVNQNILSYTSQKFDTLLLMMNGIGFCGYVDNLKVFLNYAKQLLNPGGKIIFDSSDVAYLYHNEPPEMESYYGEIDYQYEYNNQKGEWFSWLYIDPILMQKLATDAGWQLQIMYEDDNQQYLGVLTLSN
ncbi:MAG: methyltransferase domain-containing protein [Sphingobacteriales bacterium]|nr:MAG: methyltransferase domain-containing protein [Sphingobacteriales bacterium]